MYCKIFGTGLHGKEHLHHLRQCRIHVFHNKTEANITIYLFVLLCNSNEQPNVLKLQ